MAHEDYLFMALLICTLYFIYWMGGHSWKH